MSRKSAADRLIRGHNIRAFEAWLASIASQTATPALAWASAVVAVPRDPTVPPTVVVVIGLKARALFALGFLHLWAWVRVRWTLGKHRRGYRIRVRFV